MSKYTHLVSERVREELEAYIEDAGLGPHDALPPERALAERFGVNRLTLRRALQQMVYENRLYTLHGKGTFVAPPKYLEDTTLISFSAGWQQDGYHPNNRVLHFRLGEANIKAARGLGIPVGAPVYDLRRLRMLDGNVLSVERCYIPADSCPGLLQYDFGGTRSLYATMEEAYGIVPVRQVQNISITTLDTSEAELLETPEGESAFCTVATSYDAGDVAREYSAALTRADRYAVSCVAVTRVV